jgi:hypothetical protein
VNWTPPNWTPTDQELENAIRAMADALRQFADACNKLVIDFLKTARAISRPLDVHVRLAVILKRMRGREIHLRRYRRRGERMRRRT